MLSQTSAFLTRSIRQESRLISHHMVRGGMVLLMLFLLGLQVLETPRFGASGLKLILNVMNCCYGCLTLLGVMYFSVAITEEKEEETLPLLRMTGISDATLLLGKSLPRLAVVVLLILIAAPFLLLAVTLGGVVPEQIFASLLGLICYAFCLSQLGLFASTVCRISARAVLGTFLLWLFFEFGSWIFTLAGYAFDEWNLSGLEYLCQWIAGRWWEWTMWEASITYLSFDRGDSVFHPQMLFHLMIGSGFFLASLRLFEPLNRHAIAQTGTTNLALPASVQAIRAQIRSLRSIRCWPMALEWKSWQFVGGGQMMFWVWMCGLPAASVAIIIAISILVQDMAPAEAYAGAMMLIGTGGLVLIVGRSLGMLFNKEIFEQTLVSLCMLPIGRGVMLRRMVIGLVPYLIPPIVCFTLGFFWMMMVENWFIRDTLELVQEPWFWATLSWAVVTFHVGTLFSVYFRHGGMLIAVALCCFILPLMGGMLIAAMDTMSRGGIGRGGEDFFQYIVPVFVMASHVPMVFALHKMILLRIEELAGR